MSLLNHWSTSYGAILSRYSVPALIPEGRRVVFILESPHVEELLYGAPVSGPSGLAMTKQVLGSDYPLPFGRTLLRCQEHEESLPYGVLNICPVPMQQLAYDHPSVITRYGRLSDDEREVVTCLTAFRLHPSRPSHQQHPLHAHLVSQFRETLKSYDHPGTLFIPCGQTAASFTKQATSLVSLRGSLLSGVPHPSFGNWKRKRYQETLATMMKAISLHLME